MFLHGLCFGAYLQVLLWVPAPTSLQEGLWTARWDKHFAPHGSSSHVLHSHRKQTNIAYKYRLAFLQTNGLRMSSVTYASLLFLQDDWLVCLLLISSCHTKTQNKYLLNKSIVSTLVLNKTFSLSWWKKVWLNYVVCVHISVSTLLYFHLNYQNLNI